MWHCSEGWILIDREAVAPLRIVKEVVQSDLPTQLVPRRIALPDKISAHSLSRRQRWRDVPLGKSIHLSHSDPPPEPQPQPQPQPEPELSGEGWWDGDGVWEGTAGAVTHRYGLSTLSDLKTVRIVRFVGPNTPILEAETTFSGPSLDACDIMGGRYSATLVAGGTELEWSDGDRWLRVATRRRHSTATHVKAKMETTIDEVAQPSEGVPPSHHAPKRSDWLLPTAGQAGSQVLMQQTPPPTAVRRILGHGFTPMSELSQLRAENARLRDALREDANIQPRHDDDGQQDTCGENVVSAPPADTKNGNADGRNSSNSSSSSSSSDGSQYHLSARIQRSQPNAKVQEQATPFERVAIEKTRRGVGLRIDQNGEVLSVSSEASAAGAVSVNCTAHY